MTNWAALTEGFCDGYITSYSSRCLWTSDHMTCSQPISERAETRADSYNTATRLWQPPFQRLHWNNANTSTTNYYYKLLLLLLLLLHRGVFGGDWTMALAAPINVRIVLISNLTDLNILILTIIALLSLSRSGNELRRLGNVYNTLLLLNDYCVISAIPSLVIYLHWFFSVSLLIICLSADYSNTLENG